MKGKRVRNPFLGGSMPEHWETALYSIEDDHHKNSNSLVSDCASCMMNSLASALRFIIISKDRGLSNWKALPY